MRSAVDRQFLTIGAGSKGDREGQAWPLASFVEAIAKVWSAKTIAAMRQDMLQR